MSGFKVYVTDYNFRDVEHEKNIINKYNGELIPLQCKTEKDIIEQCKDAFGLINQFSPVTRKVIESLPNLKVIARYGIGVDTIDIPAATERGICVANVPDYSLDEVSDHAVALLMTLYRKIILFNNNTKGGNWDYKVGVPIGRLRGQNLGLVGFGHIAQKVAEKLAAFGLNLLVFDPYVPEEVVKKYNGQLVSLEELLERSDFISFHIPLTAKTKHMMSEKQLKMMKKSAVIVNTCRGPVIDEKALIKALKEGWIAGAGVDVLENEPPKPDSPLFNMENVIVTPHAAWYSEDSTIELRIKTARGVAEVMQGYFPKYLVNRELKDRLHLKNILQK